jgi:3-dehydroquinate synthase
MTPKDVEVHSMKKYQVPLGERSYPIYIGSQLLARLPQLLQEVGMETLQICMMISDSHVAPLYAKQVTQVLHRAGYRVGLYVIPAGEINKSIYQVRKIVENCYTFGLNRHSVIIALGGGVVGDIAGFVAAIYMRGISWIQVPTTLLAHDSSIGGKVGVNHAGGKNVIGAFHQPKMVCFDVDTLATLPKREILSGYAEVIKHALIWDEPFVAWLEQVEQDLLCLHPAKVAVAIERGCQIKATIVAQDEKETGLRVILNYGHTLGHALEAVSAYHYYTHGEAVAIGMAGAVQLSQTVCGTSREVVERTLHLLQSFQLPVNYPPLWSTSQLLHRMKKDKKTKSNEYTFILAQKIGKVVLVRGVEESPIRDMLRLLRRGI